MTDAEGEGERARHLALKLRSFRHRRDLDNPNPVLESPSLRTRLELEQIHGLSEVSALRTTDDMAIEDERTSPQSLPQWPPKLLQNA